MTAFNVNLSCALTIPNAAGGDPTAVQSLLDAVCPKILPLGLVLLCYWLLAKKKVNVIPLLLVCSLSASLFVSWASSPSDIRRTESYVD